MARFLAILAALVVVFVASLSWIREAERGVGARTGDVAVPATEAPGHMNGASPLLPAAPAGTQRKAIPPDPPSRSPRVPSRPKPTQARENTEAALFVVSRPGTLSGFVVGEDGVPLSDAKVYLHYPGEDEVAFHRGIEPEPRGRTSVRGDFLLTDVLPGTVRVMARHVGFSDGEWITVALEPGARVEGLEIELTRGGRVEGQVDSSVGDLAGRRIGLYSHRGAIGWRDARTDSTGHFAIENVVPQDYVIDLNPAPNRVWVAWAKIDQGIRKNISVREGETTFVTFGETRRRVTIRGAVSMARKPVRGLSVRPHSKKNEDRGEEVRTGADGRFELSVAGPGDYVFLLSANEGSYISFESSVPDQDLVELDFEVPAGAIAGRVLDAEGRAPGPVGITLVKIGYKDTDSRTFYECYRSMRTDREGRFRFKLLAPGSYTLRAPDGFQDDRSAPRWPHGRTVITDLVVEDRDVAGIKLQLASESRISGLVVDVLGNPVTDAWVSALDERGLPLAGDGWDTRTDSTGHFMIENVAPGIHSVRALSGEIMAKSATFDVEAGKTARTRVEIR